MTSLRKVISGGQTGADYGGLVAAKACGLETGGWAPQGWMTELGPEEKLLSVLGLVEHSRPDYKTRTEANVLGSDGTIIFGRIRSPGSAFTKHLCFDWNFPCCHIYFNRPYHINAEIQKAEIEQAVEWLKSSEIKVLNVAGNRESRNRGIEHFTTDFLIKCFTRLISSSRVKERRDRQ